jgi:very-short-patch-repair endonuclease
MYARIDPSDDLRALAAAQSGVVSAEQVALLKLPRDPLRRLLRDGHWQRLTPGIYFLGFGDPTWLARAWAGVLLGGPDARLGFEAAGHVWGLVDEPPDELRVLVPANRQVSARECWTFPRERLGVRSARSSGTPPCTSVADTVVDLCAIADDAGVVDWVTKAVQGRQITAAELLHCVQARRRLPNRGTMLALLGDVREGAESALELRYLQDVERAHGLPRGKRQRRSNSGKEVRDVLYEEYVTIVELDGSPHALRRLRDMRRDNAALLAGQVTLRYGWPDVTERPCQVAWQVAAILTSRGWMGLPSRCPWCENASDTDLMLA